VPRVLVITPNFEDYLTDGLLHGLRTLLGQDAIDFPKAEPMYRSMAAHDRGARVRGGGFTLYGTLDDLPIDRHRVIWRAVHEREFDLIVFGDIWRTFGLWTEMAPQLKDTPCAVLDGADRVEPFPYSGLWWRVPSWWTLPRTQRRATYFKREITPWTYWFRSYLTLPPPLGRAAGLLRKMRPIAFSIPEEKIVREPPVKEKEFGAHVVDEEVARAIGGTASYAFEEESAYYEDLRRSRFGITTKRAGWDALRHYEIAANGAVPCFRELWRKPAGCAPHGLVDGENCIAYRDVEDLRRRIAALDGKGYDRLQEGALSWVRANTTVVRARELLSVYGLRA
jgi:hypothetical protein